MTAATCICVDVDPQTYSHQVQMVNPFGKTRLIVCIDVCLATTVAELWHQGVETTNSCCGHGDMDASVCVTEASFPKMVELGWRQDADREFVWYPPAADSEPVGTEERVRALAAEWLTVADGLDSALFPKPYEAAAYRIAAGDLLALLAAPADEARAEAATCRTCGELVTHETSGGWFHTNPGTYWHGALPLLRAPAPVVPAEPEVEVLAKVVQKGISSDPDSTAWEDMARAVLAAGYLSPSQVRARERAAWAHGYTAGHSNAMRQMSDEPNAPTTPNPFGGDA